MPATARWRFKLQMIEAVFLQTLERCNVFLNERGDKYVCCKILAISRNVSKKVLLHMEKHENSKSSACILFKQAVMSQNNKITQKHFYFQDMK